MRLTSLRIIGIAVLLLSLFFFFANYSSGVFLLALIGLIFLFSSKDYGEKQFNLLVSSFKLNSFISILFFDVLFWFVFFISSAFLSLAINGVVEKTLKIADPNVINTLDVAKINLTNGLIVKFFSLSAVLLIAFLVIILFAYSASRALIWLSLLKKKFTKKEFFKFVLFNLLWCIFWFIIISLLILKRDPSWIPPIAVFVLANYFHLTSTAHFYLAKNESLKNSFSKAFSIGYGRIHLFILPYALLTLIYYIISSLLYFIPSGIFAGVVNFVFFLAIVGFARMHLSNIYK